MQEKLKTYMQKPLSYWLKRVIFLCIIGAVVYIVTNFTLSDITITKPVSSNEPVIVTAERQGSKSSYEPKSVGSVYILRRDTVVIKASSGSLATTVQIPALPVFSFKSMAITIQQDLGAFKIGKDSKDCSLYDTQKNIPVSIECNNIKYTNSAYRYEKVSPTNWENVRERIPRLVSVRQFGDGYIGVNQDISLEESSDDRATRPIVVGVFGEKTRSYDAPGGIDKRLVRFASINTNSNENSKQFIITSLDGNIYIGTINGDSVAYTPLDHTADYNQETGTTCVTTTKKSYCYQGESSLAVLPRENKSIQNSGTKTGVIREIDMENPSTKTKDYVTRAGLSLKSLVVKDDTLFGLADDGNLYSLEKNGSTIDDLLYAKKVSSISGAARVLYVADNSVYEIDSSTQSHVIFESKNIIIQSVWSFMNHEVVKGAVRGGGSALHTYVLNSSVNTTPGKRLIDLVPIDFKDAKSISAMDLVNDTIYVRVAIPFSKLSNKAVDETDYEQARMSVRNLLAQKGVDVNTTEIVFGY